MKRRLAGILLLVFAALPAAATETVRHIRVVLDLSKSMATNDQPHLAILATALLYDLAQLNLSRGDSFEVIPFDQNWSWNDPDTTPPVSTRPRIKAQRDGRANFIAQLNALPYDASSTYFYPGLLAAIQDLEQVREEGYTSRTIVLITDGVALGGDKELKRIRGELGPRLEQRNVRLYVLAFGNEANTHQDFFNQMLLSPKGTLLGKSFVDASGDNILNHMLEIFSHSFGYSTDNGAFGIPGTTTLDLEKSERPAKVVVTVFWKSPQVPRLTLRPPAGGAVNSPDGVQSANVSGASYSLMWVERPGSGDYGFDSDAIQGTVAVLRPRRVTLEVLSMPPRKQMERAIAETPFPLQILVKSATGGDPGPVDLTYTTNGDRLPAPLPDGSQYKWTGEMGGPSNGQGTPTPQGRIYEISPRFEKDREKPSEMYVGYLEVQAKSGDAVVGDLRGLHAHRVEVHPQLSISPFPSSDYISGNALSRHQSACKTFSFNLDGGLLPHPDKPSYSIRAVLLPPDQAVLEGELHEASFTLDGEPLEFEGKPGFQQGAWSKGRALSPEQLLGKHEVCVRIGKPARGDTSKPLLLELSTTLRDVPYDESGAIHPFTMKILVSPPTMLEKWRIALITSAALLGVLALLWYTRDRPVLPRDLGYAIGREESMAPLTSRDVDERSPLARLFGLTGESAVIAPAEDKTLAWIRPADAELFRVRPARGVRLENIDSNDAIPLHRGLAALAIQRTYRLKTDRGAYFFRLEYR